jgi:acetyl-CoA carboxylase carboxyltransferase component
MLMHTKGILIMTPDSAMVLTGKQSLDYSGGVSADDNFGIGGYDRIMGPNGQAQYWAPDLSGAVDVLLSHYEHTYVAPGERFPRPAPTTDPADRDISASPHAGPGSDFTVLGEVFDPAVNGDRKRPFDVRSLLRGVADADHPPLERWPDMHDAESVVVLDAHLGGQPVTLIGVESRPLPRRGPFPVDGPSQWTAGTLFPRSSKKTARAINAASGNPRSSCWPTCRALTALPSRCAACSLSTAPRSAGRWSTSTGRSCSAWSPAITAGRSWCSQRR